MRHLFKSDDTMSTIKSGCANTNPDRIQEKCILFADDLETQRRHTGSAKANKKTSVNQQVDNIAQKPIEQGI